MLGCGPLVHLLSLDTAPAAYADLEPDQAQSPGVPEVLGVPACLSLLWHGNAQLPQGGPAL